MFFTNILREIIYVKFKCLLVWHHPFNFPRQTCSVQLSHSVVPGFCDPINCSTPGLPVHHQLSELAETHVHRVGDAIQPSHPLSSPCPPAFNLSQHQGFFKWGFFRIRWPKNWSFSFSISPSKWKFRTDFL